ncbi:MAG: outer membrane lipoprotein-sorting protein [Saprospiraceae bacterium]|jgi:outer membrane lipoprotein-sorting protein
MKHLLSIIFVLVITGIVAAQDGIPEQLLHIEKSDPEAKAILDKTQKLYNSYKSMEVDFTLTIEVPQEDPEIQKGEIVQFGDKSRLKLPGFLIICDGKTVWTHLKKNKQVQISNFEVLEEGSEEFLSPKDFLKMYERGDFYYVLMNEAYEGKTPIQQIEFKPKDNDSEYSKMRLTINKNNSQMMRVKVFNKDGTRFTLAIDQLKSNQTYTDATFKLDLKSLPEDIEVEDLRL